MLSTVSIGPSLRRHTAQQWVRVGHLARLRTARRHLRQLALHSNDRDPCPDDDTEEHGRDRRENHAPPAAAWRALLRGEHGRWPRLKGVTGGVDPHTPESSRCCTPVPGDEIMGFITRGRGVSVHRVDCANAASLANGQQERVVDVDWDAESAGDFVALVEVKALDRPRLLQDVTATLSEHHVNILSATVSTSNDRLALSRFVFEMGDIVHLDRVLNAVRRIDAVYDVYRVTSG